MMSWHAQRSLLEIGRFSREELPALINAGRAFMVCEADELPGIVPKFES
jgi:hypothetical protein